MSTAVERAGRSELGAVSALGRLSPEQLAVVKQTVAQGASDAELAMFLELARRYQLDPFAREIWCVKYGGASGPATITTSRDGYLAIANRHPAYRGMASDVVRDGDQFSRKGVDVEHAYGAKRGAIVGAYALVYRSDRDLPAFFFAPFAEYDKKTGTWKTYPSAMIVKVAEAMALKRAFSISGLVTEEEMGVIDVEARPAGQRAPAPEAGQERWAAIKAAAATAGVGQEDLLALAARHQVKAQADLTDDARYKAIMAELRGPEAVDGDVVDEASGEATEPAEESSAPEGEPGGGDRAEGPGPNPPGPSGAEAEQQVLDQAWEDSGRPEDPG